jgi:hypothetical protein
MKSDEFNLKLSCDDIGQIIDAICVRRDAWRYTQRYLEDGYEEQDRIIEECKDPDEACKIVGHYDDILKNIKSQYQET